MGVGLQGFRVFSRFLPSRLLVCAATQTRMRVCFGDRGRLSVLDVRGSFKAIESTLALAAAQGSRALGCCRLCSLTVDSGPGT